MPCEVALQLNVLMEFPETRRRLSEATARGSHLDKCVTYYHIYVVSLRKRQMITVMSN